VALVPLPLVQTEINRARLFSNKRRYNLLSWGDPDTCA
jgi:hypothetical protein